MNLSAEKGKNMNNPQIEEPKISETTESQNLSKSAKKQRRMVWGMMMIPLILFIILIGYLIYDLQLDRTSRWDLEDVATKKSTLFSEIGKEALLAETAKEKTFQKDQQIENKAPMDVDITEKKLAPSPNRKEDQLAELSNLAETMKLPEKIVIYFELNSNELLKQTYAELDQIARVVTKYPDSKIIIEGYTDSLGNHAYNQKLSEFRANIVKNYLVGRGIDPSKMTTVGHGPKNFIASNETEDGRKLNRRVEIKLDAN